MLVALLFGPGVLLRAFLAPPGRAVEVPLYAAAFWVVAACIHPSAEITIRNVGISAGRRTCRDKTRRLGRPFERAIST